MGGAREGEGIVGRGGDVMEVDEGAESVPILLYTPSYEFRWLSNLGWAATELGRSLLGPTKAILSFNFVSSIRHYIFLFWGITRLQLDKNKWALDLGRRGMRLKSPQIPDNTGRVQYLRVSPICSKF